jgi:hypothetical protein
VFESSALHEQNCVGYPIDVSPHAHWMTCGAVGELVSLGPASLDPVSLVPASLASGTHRMFDGSVDAQTYPVSQ